MFLEHQIIITEEYCDTEDWSNGCWKLSFAITKINYILKYIRNQLLHSIPVLLYL